MILHPAIIALILESVLGSMLILTASVFGLRIVRGWDLKSGSELQLKLERSTTLVSTLIVSVFGFKALSLFLFIYTADALHTLFVGAMCAAGSLNINQYGYPVLVVKVVSFILAGIWLIMNHADTRGYDYPLIKIKYLFLLFLAPLVVFEMLLQGMYFLNLKADVITSCCGSLFGTETTRGNGFLSLILGLPFKPLRLAFYGTGTLTLTLGFLFLRGFIRIGRVFSLTSVAFFLLSIVSLISFLSLYYYELPTHHCPFCILQRDYFYTGFLLYAMLLGGVICGAGVGILMPFRDIPSLREDLPLLQKRLAALSMGLNAIFIAMISWQMVFSNLVLDSQ